MEILGGTFLILVLWALGFALYFLPSFLGWNKRNSVAIIALNLLLGWTVIGWVVALVWSLTAEQPGVVLVQSVPRERVLLPSPILCSACGRYSPASSRFCESCGASLSG